MNKYLLLRDNKQTGPYTLEEIVAKGFKAYDLVWLEGRSAAWRYPSELPEFKQFAPIVEEQPYDRFYKKPADQPSPDQDDVTKKEITPVKEIVAPVAASVIEEVAVMEEVPVVKPVPVKTKKIYVTMPAARAYSNGTNGSVVGSTKKQETIQQVPVTNNNKEYKRFEPLPADIIADKKESVQEPVAIEQAINRQEDEIAIPVAPRRKKGAGRAVMVFLGAACLILAGIVIGLAISFNKQQSDKTQLDSLVKQIQDRQNKPAAEKVPAPQPVINTVVPDSAALTDSVAKPPITDEAIVKDSKQSALRIKKDASTQQPPADNKSVALTASNVDRENEMKVTSAVVSTKDKTTYTQAQIESARKNIYQMVSVESNKFKVGVLGGISDLHITISNNSSYPLDQVIVEVKYFGPERKLVKTQSMLFNEIAAGEQKTLEVPRTSRGVTIDYSVTQINSRVLGLAQVK